MYNAELPDKDYKAGWQFPFQNYIFPSFKILRFEGVKILSCQPIFKEIDFQNIETVSALNQTKTAHLFREDEQLSFVL